jgi:hypothetical protein
MLTTAILMTALSLAPAQSGPLNVSNVRTTYGPLGSPRSNNRILPGDLVCLCLDVKGFQPNSAGKIHYGVGLEVADNKGDMVFKNAPSDLELASPSRGQPVPVCAKVEVGLASPPGKYDLKVAIVFVVFACCVSRTTYLVWSVRGAAIGSIQRSVARCSKASERETRRLTKASFTILSSDLSARQQWPPFRFPCFAAAPRRPRQGHAFAEQP